MEDKMMIATTLELLQGPAQSISTPVLIQEWIGTVLIGLVTLILGGIVLAAICAACVGIYNEWKEGKRQRKMRDSMERRELEARRFELQQMSAEQMTRAAALDRKERDLLEREKETAKAEAK